MAGHWTTPSAGVPWVMLSGYNTAGMVVSDLGKRGRPVAPRAKATEQVAVD
jgi:hypothetical protein